MKKGFSLIELIVAIAIFLIISGMIFSGINTFFRFKTMYDQEMIIQRNFRAAVDRISQDMRAAVEYNNSVIQSPSENSIGNTLEFYINGNQKVTYTLKRLGPGGTAPCVIERNGQPITEEMNQLVELYFATDGRSVVVIIVGKSNYLGKENKISFTSLVYTRNTGFGK